MNDTLIDLVQYCKDLEEHSRILPLAAKDDILFILAEIDRIQGRILTILAA